MLGLLYVMGLPEQLSQTYQSYGVYLFHKPSNTIRSMLVHPKDKTPQDKLCGTIYHITCDDDTHHTYIGETKRPLSVRFKEHCKLDKPTGVGDHIKQRAPSIMKPIYGQIIPRPPSEPNHPQDHCVIKICWRHVETWQSSHTKFQSE